MTGKIRIQIAPGRDVAPLIDAFYSRNDSQATARPDDVFFMAFLGGSCGETLVGCVRFCVEEGAPLLRTMMIDKDHRRLGIGRELLRAFAEYLDRNQIRDVHCLPYGHLPGFYGIIGFQTIVPSDAPEFLYKRYQTNQGKSPTNGKAYLIMRRP